MISELGRNASKADWLVGGMVLISALLHLLRRWFVFVSDDTAAEEVEVAAGAKVADGAAISNVETPKGVGDDVHIDIGDTCHGRAAGRALDDMARIRGWSIAQGSELLF